MATNKTTERAGTTGKFEAPKNKNSAPNQSSKDESNAAGGGGPSNKGSNDRRSAPMTGSDDVSSRDRGDRGGQADQNQGREQGRTDQGKRTDGNVAVKDDENCGCDGSSKPSNRSGGSNGDGSNIDEPESQRKGDSSQIDGNARAR